MRRKVTLEAVLTWAVNREAKDDHLTTGERQDVIRRYLAEHPGYVLTGDVDTDFVNIVLG